MVRRKWMKKTIAIYVLLLSSMLSFLCAADKKSEVVSSASPLLVVSCSLNPYSRSAELAQYAVEYLKLKGQDVDFIDLRQYNLPIANGHDQSAYDDPQVKNIHDRIFKAHAVIIASPIYNYSVAATTKNLVELTTHPHKDILSGQAWRNKIVGFMGVSGSEGSLLAFLPFLSSLMMDAKVVVVPAFVMASGEDFKNQNKVSQNIKKRIEELSDKMVQFSQALYPSPAPAGRPLLLRER
jgi:NAD(P)H-dependent FMN reductase